MKTIKITNESYEFIKNLVNEIETQNNRHTAIPYGYMIRDEVEYEHIDGEIKYLNPDDHDIIEKEDLVEELKEFIFENSKEAIKLFFVNDITEIDISDEIIISEYVDFRCYQEIKILKEMRFSENPNFFLTEKAIKQHIDNNHYHFRKPEDYVIHLWRNPEMKMLLKVIFEICGKKELIL